MKNFLMIAMFAFGTLTTIAQESKDEVTLLQSVYGMQKPCCFILISVA